MNPDLTFLRGQTVTCAVSGGCDSVVLLHLLQAQRETLSIDLRAAHFNHGLRKAADDDEAFVKALCERLQVPLTVGRGDVLACAEEKKLSTEEAARHLRYAFLMAQEGLIAVAHHADDQVETVLLNLLRGTGLRGLCAMERQSGRLVRPLLQTGRGAIEVYAAAHGLAYCTDETNLEDDALRNRLRHHVVPLLKRENPSLTETVSRMTALLQEDDAILTAQTAALLERARKNGGYDCRVLKDDPLCRRAVRLLLCDLENPSAAHVEAVCGLIKDLRGTREAALPGVTAVREYDILYIGKRRPQAVPEEISVQAEGCGSILWGAYEIAWQEVFGLLTVRTRRTGDAVSLPGGRKTVKKLLIDKKVPKEKREHLPVVLLDGEVVAAGDVICVYPNIEIKEREI